MALQVYDLALEMVGSIAPVAKLVRARDRNLADQLQRAASSVVLNIAEAEYSDPGNCRARLHTAAGSNRETRAALGLAVAGGHVSSSVAAAPLALGDRVQAMLWRLLH